MLLAVFGVCLLSPIWSFGDNTKKKISHNFQDDFTASQQRGKKIYLNNCATCHQTDGKGVGGVFPPLAQSDYLLANPHRAIRQIKRGLQGKIMVNGQTYNGIMPENPLKPQEITDIMNYINNAWGNKAPQIHLDMVIKALN